MLGLCNGVGCTVQLVIRNPILLVRRRLGLLGSNHRSIRLLSGKSVLSSSRVLGGERQRFRGDARGVGAMGGLHGGGVLGVA